jgi:hypothetical protein
MRRGKMGALLAGEEIGRSSINLLLRCSNGLFGASPFGPP